MHRNMKVIIEQVAKCVTVSILLDNETVHTDSYNFISIKHAEGHFADYFHQLTLNRYKESTEALPEAKKVLRLKNGTE